MQVVILDTYLCVSFPKNAFKLDLLEILLYGREFMDKKNSSKYEISAI